MLTNVENIRQEIEFENKHAIELQILIDSLQMIKRGGEEVAQKIF